MPDEPAVPDQAQADLPLTETSTDTPGAVDTTPTTDTSTAVATEAAPTSTPTQTPQAPKFLGRFHTAEQVEAYALGLERAQAQSRSTTPAPTSATPPPTVEQLRASKSHWRNEAFKAQNAGDEATYRQACTNQDWCEEQMYDARLAQESQKWQGQSAATALVNEGVELMKPYQADLVPGNPLYETASNYFNQAKAAIAAGVSVDQILSGLTVLAAAQKTGKTTAGVKQQATADFATALNRVAKTAIITGGGAATRSPSGKPDYGAMSDADFAAQEEKIVEQSKSVPWSRHRLI